MKYEVIFEKWYYVVHIYIVHFIHFNDETSTFLQYTELKHELDTSNYSVPLSADQRCDF